MKLSEWLEREYTVNRNTGRTVRMVKNIPRGVNALVVVYNDYMRGVISDLIEAYNPDVTPVIVVCKDPSTFHEKIYGVKYNYIAVEHYCAERWVEQMLGPLRAITHNIDV